MDSYVSLFFKLLIGAMAIFLFLGAWSVGIALSDISNYKQQVNYAIEQNGGLTPNALTYLAKYEANESHGHYKISSKQLGQKVAFGERVTYEITCTFPTYLPAPKEVTQTVTGMATSQVR
ncbi:hypothetical protein [Enterococcus faecalis]|uniref:hypothetical protein n=1 Tax=Enterococcus faecalis TaxID=1351 RepID=UPI002FBF1C33